MGVKPYKYGTDPEFVVSDRGQSRDAAEMFGGGDPCECCDIYPCDDCDESRDTCGCNPSDCMEYVCENCDRRGDNGDDGYRRQIGSDGHLGEFRPGPAVSPKEAVLQLQQLIKGLRNHEVYGSRGYEFIVGGGREIGDAMGSHIHISWVVPAGEDPINHVFGSRTRLNDYLYYMDRFVGLPLSLARGGARRESSCYGGMSAYDLKTYRRFDKATIFGVEYRTPPSFIKYPELYEAVMDTTQKVTMFFSEAKRHLLDKLISKHTTICRARGQNPNATIPNYQIYSELGLKVMSASIMSKLATIDIGGPIDIKRWEAWTPDKIIKHKPSPRSNHEVRYSIHLDCWVPKLRRNK